MSEIMKSQLVIWLHGDMTQAKLAELRAALDLKSRGRLTDWQDYEFGYRDLRREPDHNIEVSLWRRGMDDPEWKVDLSFQAERAPADVVDELWARTLVAAEQIGFTVTRVSLCPDQTRLDTAPELPPGTQLPAGTPTGWFVDWHDNQRPLHPLLAVWLHGRLDPPRLDLATETLGFGNQGLERGRLHDPHEVEFGYRYVPEIDRQALPARSVLITLWRAADDHWAVTAGYRDQRPPQDMIQLCLGDITLTAQHTGLQITKTWVAPHG